MTDPFGYRFRVSDEPGGPAFEWFDIAVIGTPVPLAEDDQNSGAIAIGFDFPFYGRILAPVVVMQDDAFSAEKRAGNGFKHTCIDRALGQLGDVDSGGYFLYRMITMFQKRMDSLAQGLDMWSQKAWLEI